MPHSDNDLLFAGCDAQLDTFSAKTSSPRQAPDIPARRVFVTKGPLRVTATAAREIAYLHVGAFSHPIMPRARVWRSEEVIILAQPSPNRFWAVQLVNSPTDAVERLDLVLTAICQFSEHPQISLPHIPIVEDNHEKHPSKLVLDAQAQCAQRRPHSHRSFEDSRGLTSSKRISSLPPTPGGSVSTRKAFFADKFGKEDPDVVAFHPRSGSSPTDDSFSNGHAGLKPGFKPARGMPRSESMPISRGLAPEKTPSNSRDEDETKPDRSPQPSYDQFTSSSTDEVFTPSMPADYAVDSPLDNQNASPPDPVFLSTPHQIQSQHDGAVASLSPDTVGRAEARTSLTLTINADMPPTPTAEEEPGAGNCPSDTNHHELFKTLEAILRVRGNHSLSCTDSESGSTSSLSSADSSSSNLSHKNPVFIATPKNSFSQLRAEFDNDYSLDEVLDMFEPDLLNESIEVPSVANSLAWYNHPLIPTALHPQDIARHPLHPNELVFLGTHSPKIDPRINTVGAFISWQMMNRFLTALRSDSDNSA